jgi:hypothetical protein
MREEGGGFGELQTVDSANAFPRKLVEDASSVAIRRRVSGGKMVTKVKCVTEGCLLKDQIFTTTALFIAKVASLDGPFNCPKCGKPMKVVARIPANYKGNSGAKTAPRRATSNPTARRSTKVGKKSRSKGMKIKTTGTLLRYQNVAKKATPKKLGQRKRGPSKSR